jgi:hypothetical protein
LSLVERLPERSRSAAVRQHDDYAASKRIQQIGLG